MAYQITLTDDEHERLSTAASQQGKTIEELVCAALTARLPPSPVANKPAITEREFDDVLLAVAAIERLAVENPHAHP